LQKKQQSFFVVTRDELFVAASIPQHYAGTYVSDVKLSASTVLEV